MRAATRADAPVNSPAEEELARARWYALIGELLRAPADDARLAAIAAARGHDASSDLALAFDALALACADTTAAAIEAEFEASFIGVGKPQVFVNGSYYLSGFLHERPLAELRDALARIGIARRADSADTEDHVSALCEVMRMLIVDDASLDTQREFFGRFIGPWVDQFVEALEHCGTTDFYKHVGRLASAFFAVERVAFDFDH
ncbi:MAG: molecular chaperone TorD family protein [Burkholderiaceae bacterium]|nr:molecular chaperone TorD family protein [Burkholderiaceae bacterium]